MPTATKPVKKTATKKAAPVAKTAFVLPKDVTTSKVSDTQTLVTYEGRTTVCHPDDVKDHVKALVDGTTLLA